MRTRLEFHQEMLDNLSTSHIYFQPPESIKLVYPCVIYKIDRNNILHADDKPYQKTVKYIVTIIDKNPDSALPSELENRFKYVSLDRVFTKDGLNHFVYSIYY